MTHWPKNIVVFENNEEQLQNLYKASIELGILFQGYLYTKDNVEDPPAYAVLQAYVLGSQGEWVSEEQASSWLLKQSKDIQKQFQFKNIDKLSTKHLSEALFFSLLEQTSRESHYLRDMLEFTFDLIKILYTAITFRIQIPLKPLHPFWNFYTQEEK